MTFEVYSDESLSSTWMDDVGGLIGVASQWTLPTPLADGSVVAPSRQGLERKAKVAGTAREESY